MAALRDPSGGCPWDREQGFASIAPYTIEEAYEVADAIARGDRDDLRGELGDLLFQVVFHARMAEEHGDFDFRDVAAGIADKMIQRHPHVFGGEDCPDAAAQTAAWERIKAEERARRRQGTLDGVPLGLPGLTRAVKLQARASRVGFDWGEAAPVLDKIEEEIRELRAEVEAGAPGERLSDELGDLLFACANLARHLGIDPEAALRGSNAKFERRFGHVERRLRESGRAPEEASLAEMDALWEDAKAGERGDAAALSPRGSRHRRS